GTARVRQRSLQTTQSYRALLQQTQVLSQIRHALRKIQSLLQSPRRARLRVDAPETICRYGLGAPLLPIRIRGSLFEERSRRDNRGKTTGQAARSTSSLLQARVGPVLIHFSLGVFESFFRRPAACKRIPSGAGRLGGFPPPQASLRLVVGLL